MELNFDVERCPQKYQTQSGGLANPSALSPGIRAQTTWLKLVDFLCLLFDFRGFLARHLSSRYDIHFVCLF